MSNLVILALAAIGQAMFPNYFGDQILSNGALVSLRDLPAESAQTQLSNLNIDGLKEVYVIQGANRLLIIGTSDGIRRAKSVLATIIEPELIVRRFDLPQGDGMSYLKQLTPRLAKIPGFKRAIYDPTNNSLITQGTTRALQRAALEVYKLAHQPSLLSARG